MKTGLPRVEEKRLTITVTLPDGQEIDIWVWEEADRERARLWARRFVALEKALLLTTLINRELSDLDWMLEELNAKS